MTAIFVFGSNEAGRHGKGAALYARQHKGAIYGVPFGIQGNSFAIPTKDRWLAPLPLAKIQSYVNRFIQYAEEHPTVDFEVTKIGCGLAGYTEEQIAPMFRKAPDNCHLPENWRNL